MLINAWHFLQILPLPRWRSLRIQMQRGSSLRRVTSDLRLQSQRWQLRLNGWNQSSKAAITCSALRNCRTTWMCWRRLFATRVFLWWINRLRRRQWWRLLRSQQRSKCSWLVRQIDLSAAGMFLLERWYTYSQWSWANWNTSNGVDNIRRCHQCGELSALWRSTFYSQSKESQWMPNQRHLLRFASIHRLPESAEALAGGPWNRHSQYYASRPGGLVENERNNWGLFRWVCGPSEYH